MQDNIWYGTAGPQDAEIVIVGESWGRDELNASQPFVGASGKELFRILGEAFPNRAPEQLQLAFKQTHHRNWIRERNQWLHDASIMLTNVVPDQPDGNDMSTWFNTNKEMKGKEKYRNCYPMDNVVQGRETLLKQIDAFPRKLVIACGNYALWALFANTSTTTVKGRSVPSGIMSWQGSQLYCDHAKIPLLPIIHPAAILRQWQHRHGTVHNLRRRAPLALRSQWDDPTQRHFITRPTLKQVIKHLTDYITESNYRQDFELACDIETIRGHINCISFASSPREAICIPFLTLKGRDLVPYWPFDEWMTLCALLRRLLTNNKIGFIGQNFLYDMQYIIHWLHVRPRVALDTMLAQHLCFPTLSKDLGTLSRMYCTHHKFWKNDSKEWESIGDIDLHWKYNCEDAVRTFEIAFVLRDVVRQLGKADQLAIQMNQFDLALDMMLNGILVDRKTRLELRIELAQEVARLEQWVNSCLPTYMHPVGGKSKKKAPWYRSTKQLCELFYDILGIPPQRNRKTGNQSVDDEALTWISERYAVLRPLIKAISALRSLSVFINNFLSAELDPDNYMRCSFNVGGTNTFRWSSSSNAFGRGTNMQNIPKGEED